MIQQGLTTSFKKQILLGEHDLDTDLLYIALYTALASLGPDTTEYSVATPGQITGTGYTAGGILLTNVSVNISGSTAYVDFNDPVWNPGVFTARGALIYNSSKSNKSIAVLDFGSDKTSTNTFTITLPANTASSALIRIT